MGYAATAFGDGADFPHLLQRPDQTAGAVGGLFDRNSADAGPVARRGLHLVLELGGGKLAALSVDRVQGNAGQCGDAPALGMQGMGASVAQHDSAGSAVYGKGDLVAHSPRG